MNPITQNKEALKKQPTALNDVEDLISKKTNERQVEGMNKVMEQAGQVQGSVADVMSGMEGSADRISERQGESGEKGDISAGSGGTTQSDDDDDQVQAQIRASLTRRALPSQEVMIKKIRTAINVQIKYEMKKAAALKKNLTSGSAQEYNASIAKIRTLKQLLSSVFHNTLEKVKEVYFRFFGENGKRKMG